MQPTKQPTRGERGEMDPITGQYPGSVIETKEFFRASEFWILVIASLGLMLGASTMENFEGGHAALFITVLCGSYILSRGVAKAGSAHPFWGREMPQIFDRNRDRDRDADRGLDDRADRTERLSRRDDDLSGILTRIETRLERLERTPTTTRL